MKHALMSLLFLLLSCEDAGEITGVCLYEAAGGEVACRNLWAGETTCAEEGDLAGIYAEETTCADEGYPEPCTHDHPASLWLSDGEDCASWESR